MVKEGVRSVSDHGFSVAMTYSDVEKKFIGSDKYPFSVEIAMRLGCPRNFRDRPGPFLIFDITIERVISHIIQKNRAALRCFLEVMPFLL